MAEASEGLPEGAYTSLRTYRRSRVVRLDLHVRRLQESAALQGRPYALEEERVRAAVAAALRATGHPESRLRLTFAPPRLFVSVEPFEPLPASLYREGTWCVTVPVHRESPHAKDTRFIPAAAKAYRALPPGAHEGLMVGEDGAILEGLSSNFFAVVAGALHTEDERALAGVTRTVVLEVAREVLPVSTTPVRLDGLGALSECFLTSVSRGVLGVVRIDEQEIGDGRPGPITLELTRRLAELVEREAESLA
jgi:branched-subunit amino acid aminotransferase/4-amino-4-deoxychorismate lyase